MLTEEANAAYWHAIKNQDEWHKADDDEGCLLETVAIGQCEDCGGFGPNWDDTDGPPDYAVYVAPRAGLPVEYECPGCGHTFVIHMKTGAEIVW